MIVLGRYVEFLYAVGTHLACASGVAVTVCINKLDRLILELKLPPAEAYFKLRHTLEEINNVLGAVSGGSVQVSPEAGTVCFASSLMGWCFTLQSFARLYCQHYGLTIIRTCTNFTYLSHACSPFTQYFKAHLKQSLKINNSHK